jgi:hypothetical protein
MGCGCRKNKKVTTLTAAGAEATSQFEVESPGGSVTTHNSHGEARSWAMANGGGKVRPAGTTPQGASS